MVKRSWEDWMGNDVIDDEEVVVGQTASNNSNKMGTETQRGDIIQSGGIGCGNVRRHESSPLHNPIYQ
jgi:hypothetical protein